MWWILVVASIVLLLGWLEVRSWKKPMNPRLNSVWGVGENSDRPLTGGSDFDGRRR
jgi:hypothetical protein